MHGRKPIFGSSMLSFQGSEESLFSAKNLNSAARLLCKIQQTTPMGCDSVRRAPTIAVKFGAMVVIQFFIQMIVELSSVLGKRESLVTELSHITKS
jgi:hypothetical protein